MEEGRMLLKTEWGIPSPWWVFRVSSEGGPALGKGMGCVQNNARVTVWPSGA